VQVEAAELWGIENGLRQDHAIGDDHGSFRLMRAELLERFRCLQRRRRHHRDAEAAGLLLDRTELQLHAASCGFCRTRIDGCDLMTMGHEFKKRRHREFRRAHENQTKRHVVDISWTESGLLRHGRAARVKSGQDD
jgi:hypothetical protein